MVKQYHSNLNCCLNSLFKAEVSLKNAQIAQTISANTKGFKASEKNEYSRILLPVTVYPLYSYYRKGFIAAPKCVYP